MDEFDLMLAIDDPMSLLGRHIAVLAALQHLVYLDSSLVHKTIVSLEAANTRDNGIVRPGSVATAYIAAQLDEGTIFELDDCGTFDESVDAAVIGECETVVALAPSRPTFASSGWTFDSRLKSTRRS